jgi:hypothetical protein
MHFSQLSDSEGGGGGELRVLQTLIQFLKETKCMHHPPKNTITYFYTWPNTDKANPHHLQSSAL